MISSTLRWLWALTWQCIVLGVTGGDRVAQPGQLLGVTWQLPALLVVIRREISPWYFVVTTDACSAVPLIAFFGAVLMGRTSGPQHGAGLDILMWSFLGAVIVLLPLTGIVELVRLVLSRAARPNARSTSTAAGRHTDSEVNPLSQPRPVL